MADECQFIIQESPCRFILEGYIQSEFASIVNRMVLTMLINKKISVKTLVGFKFANGTNIFLETYRCGNLDHYRVTLRFAGMKKVTDGWCPPVLPGLQVKDLVNPVGLGRIDYWKYRGLMIGLQEKNNDEFTFYNLIKPGVNKVILKNFIPITATIEKLSP